MYPTHTHSGLTVVGTYSQYPSNPRGVPRPGRMHPGDRLSRPVRLRTPVGPVTTVGIHPVPLRHLTNDQIAKPSRSEKNGRRTLITRILTRRTLRHGSQQGHSAGCGLDATELSDQRIGGSPVTGRSGKGVARKLGRAIRPLPLSQCVPAGSMEQVGQRAES